MIPWPEPNTITRPYRGLSVQEVDVPLEPGPVEALLRSREVYRRTAYLVLRHGSDAALVAVRSADPEPLLAPVAEVRLLAGPAETVWVDDPDTDVGNATSLARAALRHQRPGALAYVVRGRYEHVNFVWRPQPVRVHVTEVVPPEPPKLLEMARQAVAFDEELPPVELVLDAVEVAALVKDHPAPAYLLPCRGSGVELADRAAPLAFLDTHPPYRDDWLLVGCERSTQFHRHFYGTEPDRVDLCPLQRRAAWAELPAGERVLAKCCLTERGIRVGGTGGQDGRGVPLPENVAVVPWGSNLDEVRAALRALCGVPAVPPADVLP